MQEPVSFHEAEQRPPFLVDTRTGCYPSEKEVFLLLLLIPRLQEERRKALLAALEKGGITKLAVSSGRTREAVRQLGVAARHQLLLCMHASWLQNTRHSILAGENVPLPKESFFTFQETALGRKLTAGQKNSIQQWTMEGKTPSAIAKGLKISKDAVNFVLKHMGRYTRYAPSISDEQFRQAYIEHEGCAKRAADALRCNKATVRIHWMKLHLVEERVLPTPQQYREAYDTWKGNVKQAAEALRVSLITVREHWNMLGFPRKKVGRPRKL